MKTVEISQDKVTEEFTQWVMKQAFEICQCKVSPDYLLGNPPNEYWGFRNAQYIWVTYTDEKKEEVTENQLLAFAFFQDRTWHKNRHLYLDVVCALPGHGYGSKLLEIALAQYQSSNLYSFVSLRAFQHLTKYYQRFGFELGSAFSQRRARLLRQERELDGLHMTLYWKKPKKILSRINKKRVEQVPLMMVSSASSSSDVFGNELPRVITHKNKKEGKLIPNFRRSLLFCQIQEFQML